MSIWDWNGRDANPLLIDLYKHTADADGFSWNGTIIRITTKEELVTMSSCGQCEIPRGLWTLRITPQGVQNLGHQFLEPELQWLDHLLSVIQKGEDTSKLADPQVVADIRTSTDSSPPTQFSWGMLEQCRVLSRGHRGDFELTLDGHPLRFRYVRRGGKPYFTRVQIH